MTDSRRWRFDGTHIGAAWCSPENAHKEMDVTLGNEILRLINIEMEKVEAEIREDERQKLMNGMDKYGTYFKDHEAIIRADERRRLLEGAPLALGCDDDDPNNVPMTFHQFCDDTMPWATHSARLVDIKKLEGEKKS